MSSTLRFERVEVDVVGANVDELDLRALDRVLEAFDALARVVSAGQTDEAHALAAVRHRLQRDLARLLAGVDVARADIGDAAALGRVAVGGEQRHLLADTVERVAHRLRIDRADHDARDAGGDEVVHQARLDRGGGLLGIFEVELVIRQFALRLLDAGLGGLPEVRRAVHDEHERLLVGGLRAANERQHRRHRDAGKYCLPHIRFLHRNRRALLSRSRTTKPDDNNLLNLSTRGLLARQESFLAVLSRGAKRSRESPHEANGRNDRTWESGARDALVRLEKQTFPRQGDNGGCRKRGASLPDQRFAGS